MKTNLIIGTRQSLLALWQSNHIADLLRRQYPECTVTLKKIITKGDRILDVPLAKIGGKGLFTKELETALLEGEIDLAVHSLKDMPTVLPEGLCLTAVTKRLMPATLLSAINMLLSKHCRREQFWVLPVCAAKPSFCQHARI